MMNNANNGYFNQGGVVPQQGGFAQQSGLAFNNVTPAKTTSSTQEELDIIKSKGGSNFEFNFTDSAIAGWDFREGSQLCIELVDAATDRVRAKYTGEEFNIVMVEDQLVKELLDTFENIVDTTKLLNTSLDKNISKQIYISFGILKKLLPTAYANGKKNYNSVIQQARQQVGVMGYQGMYGQNPMMFSGQYGTAPNYFVNDSSGAPNIPQTGYYYPQPQPQPQVMQPYPQPMGYGQPMQPVQYQPQINGGTMMGGNPFVQDGQPQQVPQMTGQVPFPGSQPTTPQIPQPPVTAPQPQQATATPVPNPPIGVPAPQSTVASATI